MIGEIKMFGLIRKKTLLKEMKGIKDSNRKEDLYAKYPPKDNKQMTLNAYSTGYEDGTDNFYNGLKYFIDRQ